MNLVNSVIAIFSGFKNSVYKCQAQFMVMSLKVKEKFNIDIDTQCVSYLRKKENKIILPRKYTENGVSMAKSLEIEAIQKRNKSNLLKQKIKPGMKSVFNRSGERAIGKVKEIYNHFVNVEYGSWTESVMYQDIQSIGAAQSRSK